MKDIMFQYYVNVISSGSDRIMIEITGYYEDELEYEDNDGSEDGFYWEVKQNNKIRELTKLYLYNDYWWKLRYDENGKVIYHANSKGIIWDDL